MIEEDRPLNNDELPDDPWVFLHPSPDDVKRFGSVYDYYFHAIFCDRLNAIEFVRLWLPELTKEYDVEGLEIEPGEFYLENLQKAVVDIVWKLPPKKESGNDLRVCLIIEHKAQNNRREAFAQCLLYFALVCRRILLAKNREEDKNGFPVKMAQPLPVLVYTGDNPRYEAPDLAEFLPTSPGLAEWRSKFAIRCVNLTKAYSEGKVVGSQFLSAAVKILAASSLKTLPSELEDIFGDLRGVDWDARTNYFLTATLNCVEKSMKNMGCPPSEQDFERMVDAMQSTVARETAKSYFDVLYDRGYDRGADAGEIKSTREMVSQLSTWRFGSCSERLLAVINKINDRDRLMQICYFVQYEAETLDCLEDLARELEKDF